MTPLAEIEARAARNHLMVAGVVGGVETLPKGAQSLILLAPDEPAFWPRMTDSPEWQDGRSDPIDRWSKRIIGSLAQTLGGTAIFPSDGPPYAPFFTWALQSGRCWASPVNLLVHDVAGLFISFRGAIALPYALPSNSGTRPCDTCAQPCLAACPVGALTDAGYDVPACHAHLDATEGADCLTRGCLVRRACPVGQDRRLPEQSAYHMGRFHR
ncbi:ferredoxin [Loktanella sp. IMCC34160]|uniref:ferredoxin n=1 Tax=Loktanella sp. IMCC34160 TaxID=2510646 RepID=UPI00101BE15F|nr:ferredoxin [Loktanella sp. IMCC34160]RYG92597.1 ferredoxin [Loktanella sp. IMCC34160]